VVLVTPAASIPEAGSPAPAPSSAVDAPTARRGPRASTAARILQATRETLAERGFADLTVESVAARSGVAKSTIYRHYRSRTDLALAVLTAMLEDVGSIPDSGDVHADLAATVDRTIELLTTTLMGRIMQGLVSEVAEDRELAAVYREQVVSRRVRDVEVLIRRGVARGQLRSDLDAEQLTDVILGPVYYRYFLAGTPFDAQFGTRLIQSLRLE
jgi:AcrR family transcriptional regulator